MIDSVSEWSARVRIPSRVPSKISFGDVVRRWDKIRRVLNNTYLCLEQPADALSLSAELVRLGLTAQDSTKGSALQLLKRTSCALKCVNLSDLSPQSLWAFWVNVFHALLLHARILGGLPQGLRQTIAFYNRYSYVVVGHVVSLVEIEHCILRCNLTRPHMQVRRHFLKVRKRSVEELEWRPCVNAPKCAAEVFECRADWRLNLVLSAGSLSSSNALPIFEDCSQEAFDAVIARCMQCTLARAGKVGQAAVELPNILHRYRDDAPAGRPRDTTQIRWACALFPGKQLKLTYLRRYDWTMHLELYAL